MSFCGKCSKRFYGKETGNYLYCPDCIKKVEVYGLYKIIIFNKKDKSIIYN